MEPKVAPDVQIARRAAAQHGVVKLAQLVAAGLGRGAIALRLRGARLHRLYRSVFAVGHTRLSREGHWLAAAFALGDGAALSHVTAGALWAIRPSASVATHLTVPTHNGRAQRPGIIVHRSTTLRPQDVTELAGIPVTSVARTLLDLAGMLAPGPLERAVERSLQLQLFDLVAVRSVLAANPRRRGAAALARIVATIHDEPAVTRSKLEGRMRDLCDAYGIPRPEVNVIVEGVEVDFFWRAQRLIVETDGHETHGTRTAFEDDRARDARFTALGYRVVRFTHRQVMRDPVRVAKTLLALTARE
jgi:hypothetical protein